MANLIQIEITEPSYLRTACISETVLKVKDVSGNFVAYRDNRQTVHLGDSMADTQVLLQPGEYEFDLTNQVAGCVDCTAEYEIVPQVCCGGEEGPITDYELFCSDVDGRVVIVTIEDGVASLTEINGDPIADGSNAVSCGGDYENIQNCYQLKADPETTYTRIVWFEAAATSTVVATVWLDESGAVVAAPASGDIEMCAKELPSKDVEIVVLCDDNGSFLRHIVHQDGEPDSVTDTTLDGLTEHTVVGDVKICDAIVEKCMRSKQDATFTSDFTAIEDAVPGSSDDVVATVDGPMDGIFATISMDNGSNWGTGTSAGQAITGVRVVPNLGSATVTFDLPGACEGVLDVTRTRLLFWDLDGQGGATNQEFVQFDTPFARVSDNLIIMDAPTNTIVGGVAGANAEHNWVEWDGLVDEIGLNREPEGSSPPRGNILLEGIEIEASVIATYTGKQQADGTWKYFDYQGVELTDPILLARLRPCDETICSEADTCEDTFFDKELCDSSVENIQLFHIDSGTEEVFRREALSNTVQEVVPGAPGVDWHQASAYDSSGDFYYLVDLGSNAWYRYQGQDLATAPDNLGVFTGDAFPPLSTGGAFDPSKLDKTAYYVSNPGKGLYEVNFTTGNITLLGTITGTVGSPSSLSIDSSGNVILTTIGGGQTRFNSIDIDTLEGTEIGSVSAEINGADYDHFANSGFYGISAADQLLYRWTALDGSDLVEIGPAPASGTLSTGRVELGESNTFIRRYTTDCETGEVSTSDINLRGESYTVSGAVQRCCCDAGSSEDSTSDEVIALCDDNGSFLRRITKDSTGLVTVTDTTLNGVTAYTPVGTVTTCTADTEFDLFDTESICYTTTANPAIQTGWARHQDSLVGNPDGFPHVNPAGIAYFTNAGAPLFTSEPGLTFVPCAGETSSTDFEQEVLCDDNGQFIRRYTITDDVLATADFELDGSTAYTVAGAVVKCAEDLGIGQACYLSTGSGSGVTRTVSTNMTSGDAAIAGDVVTIDSTLCDDATGSKVELAYTPNAQPGTWVDNGDGSVSMQTTEFGGSIDISVSPIGNAIISGPIAIEFMYLEEGSRLHGSGEPDEIINGTFGSGAITATDETQPTTVIWEEYSSRNFLALNSLGLVPVDVAIRKVSYTVTYNDGEERTVGVVLDPATGTLTHYDLETGDVVEPTCIIPCSEKEDEPQVFTTVTQQVLCAEGERFIRHTQYEDGEVINTFDTTLNMSTPIEVTEAAVERCQPRDVEIITMCELDGTQFFRHIIRDLYDNQITVRDTSFDGFTTHTASGNEEPCGCQESVWTKTLCDVDKEITALDVFLVSNSTNTVYKYDGITGAELDSFAATANYPAASAYDASSDTLYTYNQTTSEWHSYNGSDIAAGPTNLGAFPGGTITSLNYGAVDPTTGLGHFGGGAGGFVVDFQAGTLTPVPAPSIGITSLAIDESGVSHVASGSDIGTMDLATGVVTLTGSVAPSSLNGLGVDNTGNNLGLFGLDGGAAELVRWTEPDGSDAEVVGPFVAGATVDIGQAELNTTTVEFTRHYTRTCAGEVTFIDYNNEGELYTLVGNAEVCSTEEAGTSIASVSGILTNVTAAGAQSTQAGAQEVSIANVGNADALVAGAVLPAGATVTYKGYFDNAANQYNRLAPIAYNAQTSELLVSVLP